jgi:aminoglycoside phosphotransferase (APT) family kinase protein
LRGEIRKQNAARAAQLLAIIHRKSWQNAEAQTLFQTWPNFFALRVEPYLLTTGARHPALNGLFQEEADRLSRTKLALVHGDFSPKNILVGAERLVLLDCEAAWFGDPAFDAAFLLNHLLLKALHHAPWRDRYVELIFAFWFTYRRELAEKFASELERRIGRLLLMLLLARIDGKSPVEYITEENKRELARSFVGTMLPAGAFALEEIAKAWRQSLATL